ncbi:unnamed protein product [Trichobilharzia regenti]|nr:unnamed protein product [Trichobilharzia regenti]
MYNYSSEILKKPTNFMFDYGKAVNDIGDYMNSPDSPVILPPTYITSAVEVPNMHDPKLADSRLFKRRSDESST